jgi:DNA-binding MarR family transcriptional regulator
MSEKTYPNNRNAGPPFDEDKECIFYHLNKANRAAIRFWSERIAKFKVTTVQGMILYSLIKEKDGITSKGLGAKTLLDGATLTGVLDRLEAMQLIERRPKPGDRRAILICLTERGAGLAVDIQKAAIQASRDFLKDLSREDEKKFNDILDFIRQRLK